MTNVYDVEGCSIYMGTLPEHKGMASVSYNAEAVATLASRAATVFKRGKAMSLADAIHDVAPNFQSGDVFVCSYDLRRAIERHLTKRGRS